MIAKRNKQAIGQRFLQDFREAGAVEVAPDILLPASTLLDLYGEDIRARAYTSTDPLRGEVMLRPDFTVPVVQMHMAGGAEPARYCYLGEVFRKQDPGELFPWEMLACAGLAVPRPSRATMDPHWTDGGFLLALERFGYDVTDAQKAVIAFQRRFRPDQIDGIIDGECRAKLLALLLPRPQ